MRKFLAGVAALPLMLSVASAGQPLTAQQMDRVTAGYSAISLAAATGLAGESGVVFTATNTQALVQPVATVHGSVVVPCNCTGPSVTIGTEGSSTLFASAATSQSTTITTSISPGGLPIPLLPPSCGC